jgi:hypothetical protein
MQGVGLEVPQAWALDVARRTVAQGYKVPPN